jgi:hypothetical protein
MHPNVEGAKAYGDRIADAIGKHVPRPRASIADRLRDHAPIQVTVPGGSNPASRVR